MKLRWILGLGLYLVIGWGLQAQADTVNHGDFETSVSNYLSVTEMTVGSTLFYGDPQVTGESGLYFSSSVAEGSQLSSSTGEFDFVDGALSMRIAANPGRRLNGLRVRQFGTMSTLGANSFARINSSGFATVGTDVFFGSASTFVAGDELGGTFDQHYEIFFPETDQLILSLQDGLITFADVSFGFASVNTQGVILETFSVTSVPEPQWALGLAILFTSTLVVRNRIG